MASVECIDHGSRFTGEFIYIFLHLEERRLELSRFLNDMLEIG